MIHDRTAHYVECPRCMGYGDEPGAPTDPDGTALCLTCGGTGEITAARLADLEADDEQAAP